MESDPFLDSTTLEGQQRIRSYILAWLERLDYAGKLNRGWSADELGAVLWERIRQEYSPHWDGALVSNEELARVIAATMVEDYFASYPQRRPSRYSVAGPFGDASFRRAVADFIGDLEDFEAAHLPSSPDDVAAMFWEDVASHPKRWGYDVERGPFVDDETVARRIAREAARDYYALRQSIAEMRGSVER